MAENHGAWLITAMAIFLPWSTLTFCVRAWAKLASKDWGRDDYCISYALASALAHVALTCDAIQHGYGLPEAKIRVPDLEHVKYALYASQILYILSVGLCRVSAALFIARMTYLGPQAKPAHVIATSSSLWILISVFVIAFRGPLDRPWEVLEGVEATGIVIELSLWALSIHLVCSVQMRVKKRAFIICAFGARLGTVPIIVCRVLCMAPRENSDPMLAGIIPSVLTQGAIHFSIMAGCITCLRPFLRTFNATHTVESRRTAACGDSRGQSAYYYRLETLKRVERNVIDSNDSANWRLFEDSYEGHAVVYPAKPHLTTKDNSTSRHENRNPCARLRDEVMADEADGLDRSVIQRPTEVSLRDEGEV
ncbi:uncharacterized protein G6M90_00g061930 [Metarhizium brunneum]|uniref:Rhodopsin domain-containing protein n=1 Tax=Metarhizium brunneum TaxID=500148 RepID=A0A7D5YUQ8_9HYPO|nr:hypothetical protein G6M90_00g061930 [Metarhizium brunneum]